MMPVKPIEKYLLCALLAINPLFGETPAVEFMRDVKPILEHNCVSCHREDNDKGDVRLDTKAATLAGDDVLVPGDPEASSLTGPLPSHRMMNCLCPRSKMRKRIILLQIMKKVLKQWILDGADWPDDIVLEPRSAYLKPFHSWSMFNQLRSSIVYPATMKER